MHSVGACDRVDKRVGGKGMLLLLLLLGQYKREEESGMYSLEERRGELKKQG